MDVVELRGREHEDRVQRLLTQAQIHVAPDVAARRAPDVATEYRSVTGDTVDAAAGFYARCGFALVPAGSLPDGRVVLRFSWPAP